MGYFALMSGNRVEHVVVAESAEDIVGGADYYTAVDVTDLYPRPSVNWTLENNIWYPDTLTGVSKTLWNGIGFDTPVEVHEEKPVSKLKSLFGGKK